MKNLKAPHIIRFKEWRFLQLAAFLVLLMFVSPVVANSWLLKLFISFVFLNSILVAVSTDGNVESHRTAVLIIWALAALFSVLTVVYPAGSYQFIFDLLQTFFNSILLLILIYDIFLHVFRKDDVTFDAIFASLSAYLLIALFFALLYTFIYNVQPDSFRFPGEAVTDENVKGSLFYFSIVTIATLGYGDIIPVSNISRSVAVVEAVSGQFFVAVIVALLVGKLVMSMNKKN